MSGREQVGGIIRKRLRILGGHRKLALAAGAVALAWGTPGWGDSVWQVGTGNYFAATNWLPVGVPAVAGAFADIDNGGNAQITNSLSMAVTTNVNLGQNAGDIGTLDISAGKLTVNDSLTVGGSGTGTFIQSGGTLSFTLPGGGSLEPGPNVLEIGLNVQSTGSYTLSAGSLAAQGNIIVGEGGNGSFIQTGGNISDPDFVALGHMNGATGNYSMSAGSLTATTVLVSDFGPGVFTQTGGSVKMTTLEVTLRPSSSGEYIFQGGNIVASTEYVAPGGGAATAAFIQTGGINRAGTLETISKRFQSPSTTEPE